MSSHIRGLLLVFILGLAAIGGAAQERDEDHRAWQHGVDLIRVGDKLLAVWGSSGNPPRTNLGGDWQHDVYYAWLDPSAAQNPGPIIPSDPRLPARSTGAAQRRDQP